MRKLWVLLLAGSLGLLGCSPSPSGPAPGAGGGSGSGSGHATGVQTGKNYLSTAEQTAAATGQPAGPKSSGPTTPSGGSAPGGKTEAGSGK